MAMRRSTAAWLAWSSVAASAALTISTALLVTQSGPPTGVFTSGPPDGSATAVLIAGLEFLVFPIVGALIATRKPENAIGWLFCAAAIVLPLGQFGAAYGYHALDTNPGSLPGGVFLSLMSNTVWLPSIAFVTVFLLLLFPSGRPATRSDAIVFRIAIVATAIAALGGLFEVNLFGAPSITYPLGLKVPEAVGFLSFFGVVGITGCAVASVVSLVRRFRRSHGEEREQLKWFVCAASLVLVTWIPSNFFLPLWFSIASGVAVVALPLSVGIAILKYRLYDIDVVINRTVVYGALAVFITAVYVAIVVGIGALVGQAGRSNVILSVLATAIVALAFQPMRHRTQRFANRLVYGQRATPYEVLSEFAERMGGTYAADDLLPRMARILAEGTGAVRADVWLRIGRGLRPEATWPDDAERRAEIADEPLPADLRPVTHQGELLGALSVEAKSGEVLSPVEEKLVADLASQAGLVLRNVRLIDDLKSSRQRLVAAQDEERRKIERNIHDGAQQQLVALAVQQRLAASLIGKDDDGARRMLEQLQIQTNEALDDLRDLARGIYPPLLADKGLVAALEAQARKASVPVTVNADGVGRYPQELESAVYFSCLEALQNVAKYADATSAQIDLADGDAGLRFSVTDDGVGFDADATGYGTGLQGIADRLAAIGGTIDISSAPGRGTVLSGRLPIERLIA
jgi:signal transduction histidine kinase